MYIKEYFKNQEILITGGTGFLGKALIEKVLRSCPGFSKMYLLIRPKRNKTIDQRLKELLDEKFFERAKSEQPESFKKIEAISGDCIELGLGISAEDLYKLRNVTIIYHSAASVRFDDPLKKSILLNTRGTYELLKIAESLKELQVFVYVSTTYCYIERKTIGEKVYREAADWRETIKIAETVDEETLDLLNLKYSNFKPNTYTFTKALAEKIIDDYKDKVPVLIYRPSVVTATLEDPFPGWIDNFNGPLGLLVGCGLGITRTSNSAKAKMALIPVDIVIRGLIICTYKKGIERNEQSYKLVKDLDVYNSAINILSPIRFQDFIKTCQKAVLRNPFEKMLWVPGGIYTDCPVIYYSYYFAAQILPSIFCDVLLRLIGRKPMILKIQRRVYLALAIVDIFTKTDWHFEVDRFFALDKLVSQEEYNDFAFLDKSVVDYDKYASDIVRGAKEFLLKENPELTPKARKRLLILKTLDSVLRALFYILILRFIFYFIKNYFGW